MTGEPSHGDAGPTSQHDRPFLPAMGGDGLLAVYDVMTWLLGARPAHRRLVAAAGLAPGRTVLEVGCGTGNLLLAAAAAQPAATLVGLDPDPAALERARAKVARKGLPIRLEQGFADELPHPDGSVDRVLSAFMFHHLPQDAKVAMLREVRRVLVPGGELLLLDFEGQPRPLRLVAPLLRLLGHGRTHAHGHDAHGHDAHGHDAHGHGHADEPPALTPNDPAMVRELLDDAGFAGAAQVDTGKNAFGRWIIYRAVRADREGEKAQKRSGVSSTG
jgi:SAM-dependent methyltransferase